MGKVWKPQKNEKGTLLEDFFLHETAGVYSAHIQMFCFVVNCSKLYAPFLPVF
jgi:hypothetical protein